MQVKLRCSFCGVQFEQAAPAVPGHVPCPECGALIVMPGTGLVRGTMLGGFKLEEQLGQGSMGEIFLARQVSMDRQVALKILPPRITNDEVLVERFMREVRMLAKLEHPHIVTAFEAGEEQGIYYLAMSYVQGEDLVARLTRDGALPEEEALDIMSKVASALCYAWEKHLILHNDIKPANIMIDLDGDVKIMDLGLSKHAMEETGLSMTGQVYGTPSYMSPEQAKGERDIDFRSDEYAFGSTLYHLVTGEPPYKAATIVDLLRKKTNKPCRPARQVNKDVSPQTEKLLINLMAIERDKRYPSWGSVILNLERVLEGMDPLKPRPIRADEFLAMRVDELAGTVAIDIPEEGWEESPRPGRPGRRIAWIAAAVVGLLILVGGVIWFSQKAEAPSAVVDQPILESPAPTEEGGDEIVQVFFQQFPLEPEEQTPKPVDEDRLNGVLTDLRAANPAQEDLQALYWISGGDLALDLSGNRSLTDISPLKGLPITELLLHETAVADLSPLSDMPLRKLGLNRTRVRDLSVLRGMPLEELTLWQCRNVEDISPLVSSSTLKRLIVPEQCARIEDLQQVSSLRYLTTRPDGWKKASEDFWASRKNEQKDM